jgi:Alpha amylase, catalytic domain
VRWPSRPTVYEINTAVWLERLGRSSGSPVTLATVPTDAWDALAALPVDAVWLMGVWERSPAGLQIALTNQDVVAGNRQALPDLCDEDVIGSPYCVRDYVVDERFGGPEALAQARAQLAERGLALILDYVPNHVAPDHPWLTQRPECFVRGSDEDLAAHPEAFLRTAGGVVANGRDPYFPPWPDVVQLNAYSPALREAVAETLISIGEQCDGLRCDMAMLMTNEVFGRTWNPPTRQRAGPAPAEDYWPALIGRVKETHPDLLFIAEAYWDMEWTLQQQGFDLCYDKRLYDRLVHEGAESVRGHLQADPSYQEGLIRFIENHDEPRAAATFGAAQARAAAVVMSTLQGARLYHDGQLDGYRIHIPVFLGRGPDEPPDEDLRAFYARLLGAVAHSNLRGGDWQLCECSGWPDNDSYRRLVSWGWSGGGRYHLVVVNLSDGAAQARVHLPWDGLRGRSWQLCDRLSAERFERGGDELAGEGLYVALGPWDSYFLAFE